MIESHQLWPFPICQNGGSDIEEAKGKFWCGTASINCH